MKNKPTERERLAYEIQKFGIECIEKDRDFGEKLLELGGLLLVAETGRRGSG